MPPIDSFDALNDREAKRKAPFSLPTVRAQLTRTHKLLLAELTTVPGKHLAEGTPLLRRVVGDTYGHYEEHLPDLQKWLARGR